MAYFFGPITVLIVANVVLFVLSAINIYKNMDGAQKLDSDGEHKGKNRSVPTVCRNYDTFSRVIQCLAMRIIARQCQKPDASRITLAKAGQFSNNG